MGVTDRTRKVSKRFPTVKQNIMKIRPGNAQNSKLNGEWAKHVRAKRKKYTSKLRRRRDKKIIIERIQPR